MQLSVSKIILVMMLCIFCGCTMSHAGKNNKMEESSKHRLIERIDGVYLAWKERDFDKFLNYVAIDKIRIEDRKQRIDDLQRGYPPLVDYHIKGIEITDDKARVKVLVTATLNGVNHNFEHFDHWVLKENEWYLFDFGKMS